MFQVQNRAPLLKCGSGPAGLADAQVVMTRLVGTLEAAPLLRAARELQLRPHVGAAMARVRAELGEARESAVRELKLTAGGQPHLDVVGVGVDGHRSSARAAAPNALLQLPL